LFVIDASRVAQEVGLRGRTNTVLQTCFFAISGVFPREQAIGHIKQAIRKSYGGKGEAVVQANLPPLHEHPPPLFHLLVPHAAPPSARPAAMRGGSGGKHPPPCWKPAATPFR